MSFTEVYNEVLSPFAEKFKEAENEKLRKAILMNAANAVLRSRDLLEVKEDLPKDLEKVCSFLPLLFIKVDFFCVYCSLGDRSLF